mmetsp:Transcript_16773/g.25384  ORF Transcript_16773/g.25384 Transcript_16773/m.25384 type:complete len:119 (-) Transcript_16773:128-484(-)
MVLRLDVHAQMQTFTFGNPEAFLHLVVPHAKQHALHDLQRSSCHCSSSSTSLCSSSPSSSSFFLKLSTLRPPDDPLQMVATKPQSIFANRRPGGPRSRADSVADMRRGHGAQPISRRR